MSGQIYLVERTDTDTDYRYYAEHGEMGTVSEAIGYECPAYARKFCTEDDAMRFICEELPKWGQALHKPTAFGFADFAWEAAELSALLRHGESIPNSMLTPTAGRLRLWRR